MSSLSSVAKARRMHSEVWKNFSLTVSMVQGLRTAKESNGVSGSQDFRSEVDFRRKAGFRAHPLENVCQ